MQDLVPGVRVDLEERIALMRKSGVVRLTRDSPPLLLGLLTLALALALALVPTFALALALALTLPRCASRTTLARSARSRSSSAWRGT